MTNPGSPSPTPLAPFLRQEYLRIMRGRLAKLIWAMMIYSVAMLPFVMLKPPQEIMEAIEAWLGTAASPSKLILFMWVDAGMNKFAMIMGPALAGGIIVDERSRGLLDLCASKPIRAADYFSVKLAAAWAAMATFYASGAIGALLTFPWRLSAFDPAAFMALSVVHLFAALFAVTLSAVIALFFNRRLTGMLVSISVLSLLVGLAFLGFYNPAYRAASQLNPFFNGVVLIGSIDDYGPLDLAWPIGSLVVFNLGFAWLGRRRAAILLEESQSRGSRADRGAEPDSSKIAPQSRETKPLIALLRLESKTLLHPRHVVALVLISLLGFLAFWLPRFPSSVFRFFNRVLHLADWAEIVVANNLTGLFFFVYWIIVFDVLAIAVAPREERYLDILLSKPLGHRFYLLAKLLPIMVRASGVGAVAAAIHGVWLWAAGLNYDLSALLGASLAVIGLAILLGALVNLLVLNFRDSYSALMIAFLPMIVSMLPAMIYIYRPDVFVGFESLRDQIVFPVNMVWSRNQIALWGAPLAGLMFGLAALLAILAGMRLERQDVRQ